MKDEERDDLLVRLDERTEHIETDVAKIEVHQKEQNGRLGMLERWQQRIIGAGVAALFLLSIRETVVDLFK